MMWQSNTHKIGLIRERFVDEPEQRFCQRFIDLLQKVDFSDISNIGRADFPLKGSP